MHFVFSFSISGLSNKAIPRTYQSPLVVAGNNDIHKSLDEFEILPDPTTGFHGNRQGYNGENVVATFSQLFLNKSFSYLQVMMTYIRA